MPLIVGRPMAESQLGETLALSRGDVRRLLDAYAVRPAFRIGRVRCYTPEQVELLHSIVEDLRDVPASA
jgi:hypothetical protein